MIYYEINFTKFYYPLQQTHDGWVFGFIRKRREPTIEKTYRLLDDPDFMTGVQQNIDDQT